MQPEQYVITLEAESEQSADVNISIFADNLREVAGVLHVNRIKKSENTMDLGSIVGVVVTSGATLALAQGIADWLRARQSISFVIERDKSTDSIKAIVSRTDPETAKRIIELIRDA